MGHQTTTTAYRSLPSQRCHEARPKAAAYTTILFPHQQTFVLLELAIQSTATATKPLQSPDWRKHSRQKRSETPAWHLQLSCTYFFQPFVPLQRFANSRQWLRSPMTATPFSHPQFQVRILALRTSTNRSSHVSIVAGNFFHLVISQLRSELRKCCLPFLEFSFLGSMDWMSAFRDSRRARPCIKTTLDGPTPPDASISPLLSRLQYKSTILSLASGVIFCWQPSFRQGCYSTFPHPITCDICTSPWPV